MLNFFKNTTIIFLLVLAVHKPVCAQNYFHVRVNGRWGLIDQNGKLVVKPASEYFKARAIAPGYYSVFDDSSGVDYLYHGFKKIKPIEYDSIPYSKKNGPGWVNEKGYYDEFGKRLRTDNFIRTEPFYEGMALVHCSDAKYPDNREFDHIGFIDRTGKTVIPCIYELRDLEDQYTNGAIKFWSRTSRYGYLNTRGDTIVKDLYDMESRAFSEDRAAVQKNDRWNFVTKTGELISTEWWKDVKDYSEGLALVHDTLDRIYYIDKTGKKVFELDTTRFAKEYYQHGTFSEGLASVMTKTGFYGYMNKQGKMAIPAQYHDAQNFSEGFAVVCDSTGCFFIDRTGKQLTTKRFDDLEGFENGLARVYIGNDVGQQITGCVVMGTHDRFMNGKAYSRDLKMGYINRQGKVVWKPTE